ncbi:MAG TPA: hypothetical protein VI750_03495 [Pyrinomonadaceae bacterium]|nr:hypothetical protein [Pyrinomonadaceae bacterium]
MKLEERRIPSGFLTNIFSVAGGTKIPYEHAKKPRAVEVGNFHARTGWSALCIYTQALSRIRQGKRRSENPKIWEYPEISTDEVDGLSLRFEPTQEMKCGIRGLSTHIASL